MKWLVWFAILLIIFNACELLSLFGSDEDLCEGRIVVEVRNGCGIKGIGEVVGRKLRNYGFDVIYIGNAEDFNFGKTIVVDRCGDLSKAREVARRLGTDAVLQQINTNLFVDVTVIVGHDVTGLLVPGQREGTIPR